MTGQEIIRLMIFILPLGLDTFALSTVLGMQPLSPRHRLRLALIFALAEGAMPALGPSFLAFPWETQSASGVTWFPGPCLSGLGSGYGVKNSVSRMKTKEKQSR